MMIASGIAYIPIIPMKEYIISMDSFGKKWYVTHWVYEVTFGWCSTWKIIACGVLHTKDASHAIMIITLPRRSIPANFIGWVTAKYLQESQYLWVHIMRHTNYSDAGSMCGFAYLSIEMQTSTKLDRYRPNVRKNDINRHIASPATHCTVNAQPISIGIVKNVTKRSAKAKCISIASILDGLLMRRSISSFSTVKLHTADIIINML